MAFLNEDEKKKTIGGSGGAFIGGGSSQGATTGVKDAPTASGNFTNIQNYLTANEGSDAAMGEAAKAQVGASYGEAEGAQNALANEASSSIQSGTPVVDQNTISGIANWQPSNYGQQINSLSRGQTSTYNPVSVTPPPAVAYTGPTSYNQLSGAQGVESSAQRAEERVGLTNNQAGVSELLRGAYANPNYTSGEGNLDAFLTGSGAGGQQQLAQARQQFGDIQQKKGNLYSGIMGQIGTAQNQVADVNNQYDAARTARGDELNQGLENARLKGQEYKANLANEKRKAREVEQNSGYIPGQLMLPTGDVPAIPKGNTGRSSRRTPRAGGASVGGLNTAIPLAHGGKIPYYGIQEILRRKNNEC